MSNNENKKVEGDQTEDTPGNLKDAKKAEEELLKNLAIGSGSSAKQIANAEDQILVLESNLSITASRIAEIEEQLKNSGKFGLNGKTVGLSSFTKKSLYKEKRNLKKAKNNFKAQISELSRLYTALNKIDAKKDRRVSTHTSAKKESYHKQHGEAVKSAITQEIAAMGEQALAALVLNLSKLNSKEGDALIMKTLLKAPRFLHTKVVANKEARGGYLQFFRNELGVTKKAPKGRRRNNN